MGRVYGLNGYRDRHVAILPELFEFNKVLDVGDFLSQRNLRVVAFIELIAQQIRKFCQRRRRHVRIFMNQKKNGIDGVEQEMRIKLVFEKLQFRFEFFLFQFNAAVVGSESSF